MSIKIAHITNYHPGRSGLYEQAREQIVAENKVGLTSYFINNDPKAFAQKYLSDRGAKSKGLDWVEESDIVVLHQMLPNSYLMQIRKPMMLIAHGTPKDCMWGEVFQGTKSYSLLMTLSKMKYVHFITMWERHAVFWRTITDKVYCVTPGIELDRFSIEGPTHEFKAHEIGKPNIMFADTWRIDKNPFEITQGFHYFKDKYPEARLHIYASPIGRPEWNDTWKEFFELQGRKHKLFLGELGGLIPTSEIEKRYRACDMLVTPKIDATRCIRECMAVGTPVIASRGHPYSPYKADHYFPYKIFEEMDHCWQDILKDRDSVRVETRRIAEENFDILDTAKQLKKIYEGLL